MSTPEPGPVLFLTGFATDITPTAATLWGLVSAPGSSGTDEGAFCCWGLSASQGDLQGGLQYTFIKPDPAVQLVSYQASGLMPATTYYFQLTAGASANSPWIPGAIVTFVTLPGPPTVTPGTTTNITSTTATLNGTVNPNGLQTHYLFGYGTDTHYQSGDSGDLSLASATGSQSVSHPISGLTPGTTYHVELVANNSAGHADSGDFTFTTLPPAPVVTTGTPSALGENTATLHGTVNPMGAPTSYYWEYGTTTSYGTKVPVPDASAGSGSTPQPVTYTAPGGFLMGTTYHYRIVATNSGGTTYGNDVTFMTESPSSPGR